MMNSFFMIMVYKMNKCANVQKYEDLFLLIAHKKNLFSLLMLKLETLSSQHQMIRDI